MSEINVLYPFDNNYAPYAGISLTSLLENNRDAESIHVFILGFDLSDETVTKFRNTVSKYNREMTLLNQKSVDDMIQTLDMPSYRGARVAVARLFVSIYMPESVDRLLYLDSDTIIVGNLTELVNADLGGNPVGMVCDSVARDYKLYMGFQPDEDYYNGGMIVYDMPKWQSMKCTEQIIDHIINVRNNYEALDQDLINIALKGKIKRLDLRYNFQPFHVVYSPKLYMRIYGNTGYYDETVIKKASEHVAILHTFRYMGMFPWHANSMHPCIDQFERYKQLSEWCNMEPNECDSSVVMKAERILYKILPKGFFLKLFRFIFREQMWRIEKQLRSQKTYINV